MITAPRHLLPLLLLGFAVACSESKTTPNPGRDAGVVSDGGGTTDASVPDSGVNPDVFEWPLPTEDIVITPSATYKNRITAPDDAFRNRPNSGEPEIRWVKFAVLVRDPSKVYFQDSAQFEYHYDFATAHLDPFKGMSRTEFDAVALHEAGQEVILGAVLFAPTPDVQELGIQLVRQDAYHPEMVRIVFELVNDSIDQPTGNRSFYMPTFEQIASANHWRSWLGARGVEVSSASRWGYNLPCYSAGWALGKLVYVEGARIHDAFVAGELTARDILLTDAVPAEIPFVAGVLTKTPSTPNAHVAILARSYGVPFATFSNAAEAEAAMALVGKQIALDAQGTFGGCHVRLIDVDGKLDAATIDEILALKAPPALAIQPKQTLGELSRSVDDMSAADIVYFGGKAANFALLRDVIGSNSPEAIALSFDLWDAYLQQSMPSGKTLAVEIADRLAGVTYPPTIATLDASLLEIRTMIESEANFTESQRTAILGALSGFDANKKVRFRSSTNVEDSDNFSGAGLYDSFSGCRADDTDADEEGPSLCDSTRAKERGVFRAIRKVYASFYNVNAFIERLRHGVDEADVGMAVLVHYSFPDKNELANGVVTSERSGGTFSVLEIVSQPGALSVTNPEGSAPPEVVRAFVSGATEPSISVRSWSSLLPLGATVLEHPAEYVALAELIRDVTNAYAASLPSGTPFLLDFEYKKITPSKLVIKQVRRVPQPAQGATTPTFLLDVGENYCVYQGEYNDVFQIHRLKSKWRIQTRNTWLDTAALTTGLLDRIDVAYMDDRTLVMQSGMPSTFSGFAHRQENSMTFDSFTVGAGAAMRTFELETHIPETVPRGVNPLLTWREFPSYLSVDYTTPVAAIDWMGVTTRSRESARLWLCTSRDDLTPGHSRQEETITGAGGLSITTAYYWPPGPTGETAGYTAPLIAWDQTTITGLTSMPIVLTGDYSQSYRPEHHNFDSQFIFDPWLEEGIATTILDELMTQNIRFIYLPPSGTEVWFLGLDGVLRQHE